MEKGRNNETIQNQARKSVILSMWCNRQINTYKNVQGFEKTHKKLKKVLALILSVASLCSGCGREKVEKAPELIEPAAINSSYRPVELGNVGNIEVLFGTVVPKQYCSFFLTGVKCSEITVQVGDYVKKGDIVAYADIDSSREELESLQEELKYENRMFEIDNDIIEEYKKQLNFVIAKKIDNATLEKNDVLKEKEEALEEVEEESTKTSADNKKAKVAAYDENIRYNRLLHQYRVNKLQEEIGALQQVVDDGVLKAGHDGYVTYVKNISYESNAQPLENIVIISDTKDIYIELSDKQINTYKYGDYEDKYINISGEKINIEEIPYSSEEMIQAKINGRYPNVRFAFPEGYNVESKKKSIKIGDTCPVCFVKSKVENVLIIAKDSLYEENGEHYVYVYKGENQKEKRKINIGESDKYYVEVTGGLQEGELVYYESDKRIPTDYSTHKIKLSDFEIENHSKTYKLSNELSFKYNCKQEGTIVSFSVAEGARVKKGDLLYIIDIGIGKAALTEAQNDINREKRSYMDTIKGLKKELAKYETKKDDYSVSQAKIVQFEMDKAYEEHNYNLKQLQDVYDMIGKDNDGKGKVSVYAEDTGIIRNIKFSENEYVVEGEEILSIGVETKDKLLVEIREILNVSVYEDNIADVGESIFIEDGDTTYEGKCVGWTVNSMNNEDKNYVHSDNENVYISFSTSSGYQYPAFYVEMNDKSFYEKLPKERMVTFSYIYMQDVIKVPKKFIQTEVLNTDEECSYVWRVVGDAIVKQYVLVNEKLSDDSDAVILSGIKEGDVLAAE